MDLRAQHAREAEVFGGRHRLDLLAYAYFVRRNPWIFGASRHAEASEAARTLLRVLLGPPPSRWVPAGETPSGKRLFRCSGCGAETPAPTAFCFRRACADEHPDP